MTAAADIGVFGGSGFYSFLADVEEHAIETPYGETSAPVVIGTVGDKRVAFLPRHGRDHRFPPHAVPYRANVWAMKELGVARLLAPTAAGSLQRHVERGHFVVPDQLVDRTSGRAATFFDGPECVHVSLADPYCAQMRPVVIDQATAMDLPVHRSGTVVVIEGPRFSTRAESRWYAQMGWEVINMTQYPEAVLAREAEICFCNISLITDFDCGVEDAPAVTVDDIVQTFKASTDKLRELLLATIDSLPAERSCSCGDALTGACVGG